MHKATLFLPILWMTAACGGQVEPTRDAGSTPGTGSNSSASSSDGGAPGFMFDVCPSDPPPVGTSCSTPDHGCAYTGFNGIPCQAYVCDSGGHWANTAGGC